MWTCYKCKTPYPLAATRRCLRLTCDVVAWSSLNRGRTGQSGRRYNGPDGQPLRRAASTTQKVDCKTSFDYEGWALWGSWRRAVTAAAPAEERRGRKRSRAEFEDQEEEELSLFELLPLYDEDGTREEIWERVSPAEERRVKRRKEVKYVEGKYDCMRHCDWPTECQHARYEAWKEGRAEHAEEGRGFVHVGERDD